MAKSGLGHICKPKISISGASSSERSALVTLCGGLTGDAFMR
jgi:hypothetical protein